MARAVNVSMQRIVALALLCCGLLSPAATEQPMPAPRPAPQPGNSSSRELQTGADITGEIGRLPLLTNAIQVKRLKREEALRRYPVRIRGVVTCVQPAYDGFVLQDVTRGVYVKYSTRRERGFPQAGEECEVEGVTDAGFSPMIRPSRVVRLGAGIMPEPVRPTWDQLMNGSLDTQYAELQGIVTTFQSDGVALFTRDGVIKVRLPELNPESFKRCEDSLVSLRGCLIARHEDENVSLRFKVGEVDLYNVLVTVIEPAPMDAFAFPRKAVAEMFLYDPQAGPFQRVRVSGQIVHERQGEYYLMEGTNGLRFSLKAEPTLQVGDLVEVAGLLQLGGPSPVLREAVARKTGRAALPAPKRLSPADLLVEDHDSTLVQVEGVLLSQRRTQTDEVLELQAGVVAFEARLSRRHPPLATISVGSRLELTGVLAGQGGSRVIGGHLTSVDLLLNSPAHIRVLARPAWWTVKRLLVMTGVLAGVLAFASVWISLLRREVERRTAQLKREIHDRERAEHQQALEAERARIARDLHDDLGSSLTEISMLAETGRDQPPPTEDPRHRFDRILGRARSMVFTLDEIVWAVDPRKDTLAALVRYLAGFAEEYVSAAGLACRVEMPPSVPEIPLKSRVRHELFLGTKEALNNAVRHAHASQVCFQIHQTERELSITIRDNGRGFDSSNPAQGNGLLNLRERLASLRGRCEIKSRSGEGTTVLLVLPVANNSYSL